MKYEVEIKSVVTVVAANTATAIHLAQLAVETGLPTEGVVQVLEELPKIVRMEE